jgi:hypothetical protein
MRYCLAVLCWGLLAMPPAHAIMAGAANGHLPDTPAKRVDPNLTSSPWAGVGSLSVKGGTYSGVLIGPQHVLTAAHVVAGAMPADIVFNVNFGGELTYRISASATTIHPGFGKNQFRGIQLDDLAIVTLASALPPGVPHYPLLSQPLDIGATILLVGYGASGDGEKGATLSGQAAVKRSGRNVIDLFLPPVKRFEFPRAYLFDYDDPYGKRNALGGASLGNDSESMIASGDSGSPAFVNLDGEWQLAGINTFQINDAARGAPPRYGALGGGMWLPAYSQWVSQSMQPQQSSDTQNGYLWMAGLPGLVGVSRLRFWQ